jgi:hypothetical protein
MSFRPIARKPADLEVLKRDHLERNALIDHHASEEQLDRMRHAETHAPENLLTRSFHDWHHTHLDCDALRFRTHLSSIREVVHTHEL